MDEMTMEQVESRMAEIQTELDSDNADVEALSAEVDKLIERKSALEEIEKQQRQTAEEKRSLLDKVAKSNIKPIATMGERKMEEKIEIRNTPEYVEAFARYIKTNDATECRALLTQNGGGDVQVPSLVYDIVKTAWEREGLMAKVRKSYLKGNLRVSFEKSADPAEIHTEGQAVTEEDLELGVVTMNPVAIKKWISISDEALDMAAVPYLEYIYDELTYRIAKKAADTIIAKIEDAPVANSDTAVAVPKVTAATVSVGTVAQAMASLSDEATNPVVIMNKLTWGALKAAQYANQFNTDPFEGLEVIFNNTIKAYDAATTGETYMIVGDLGHGALANFPAGDEITIKRDDYTLATSDLVRFIGREYVALGIVAPNAFVKVVK